MLTVDPGFVRPWRDYAEANCQPTALRSLGRRRGNGLSISVKSVLASAKAFRLRGSAKHRFGATTAGGAWVIRG